MSAHSLRLALLGALVLAAAMLAFRAGMFSPGRVAAPPDRREARRGSAAVEDGSRSRETPEAPAWFEDDAGVVTARVERVGRSAVPGEPFEAAVVVGIADGWHINANPASDEFLIATEVALGENSPVHLVSISYPKSTLKSFSFSQVPLAVYEGQLLIPVTLRAPVSAPGDSLAIPLTLTYQPCDDSRCLAPSSADLILRVPVASEPR